MNALLCILGMIGTLYYGACFYGNHEWQYAVAATLYALLAWSQYGQYKRLKNKD